MSLKDMPKMEPIDLFPPNMPSKEAGRYVALSFGEIIAQDNDRQKTREKADKENHIYIIFDLEVDHSKTWVL
jgi:hypothetical protein